MLYTIVVEKIETHILCQVTFFRKPCVDEIMSKNMVEPEMPQTTTQYGGMLHAGLVSPHARKRMHASRHPRACAHTRTQPRMHTQRRQK